MKRMITLAAVVLMTLPMVAQPPRGRGERPAPNQPRQERFDTHRPRKGAQERPDSLRRKDSMHERIEAEKIAFITSYAGLTESEAQNFWPVYNAFEAGIREAMRAEREAYRALCKAVEANAPEAELNALAKAYAKASSKNIDNEKRFEQYSKVLPADKVAKVLLSEEKFRRHQISKLRDCKRP